MERPFRSIAKTISWRVTATADTFLISWLVTGSLTLAGGIASIEVATKMFLYYGHERAWSKISWGRLAQAAADGSSALAGSRQSSEKRLAA